MNISTLCTSGDSLRLHLPISFVRSLRLKPGDQVVINLRTEGKIEITPLQTKLGELARKEAKYVKHGDKSRRN